MNLDLNNSRATGRISRAAALALAVAGLQSAFAATEQWQGVPSPGIIPTWTDANNWTSPQQTYYNQVQFRGAGASPNSDFAVNNILDATTGVAQMPIWQLDFFPTNGNYTTLINPGMTLSIAAGNGTVRVGADLVNTSGAAPADAVETITIAGEGATFSMIGDLYVSQGSPTPGDAHNVTLDLSGLDRFIDNGPANGKNNSIYVACNGAPRSHGTLYLARNNQITLGNGIEICQYGSWSNSVPGAIYLGQANAITLGSGNLVVAGNGCTTAGAFMQFNPAFVGGANPVPTASFNSSSLNGRINNFYICDANGGPNVPGRGWCDFSGGSISMLVSSMVLGQAGSASAQGTLTFDNGMVDVDNAIVGNQQVSGGGIGVGIINLNSDASLGTNATLRVNSTLTLAAASGTVQNGTAGTININGGALAANVIANGAGAGTIHLTNGTLTVSAVAGTLDAPISSLSLHSSTLHLPVLAGSNSVTVTSLQTGGAATVINIASAPPMTSYPTQIVLIKYSGTIGGAGYHFALGSLPTLFNGYLVNNTANSSVDLVLTSGSGMLTWTGSSSGDWDSITANWLLGSPARFADGQFVRFFDGASRGAVNLTTALSPAGMTVSNNTLNYTFIGSGSLAGAGSLVKAGTGVLTIDNSSANTFSGGVSITGGTLQVGNNDANGDLAAAPILNNSTLAFARSDTFTFGNTVSGSGSVVQAGTGGTLVLAGANTFTGEVLVTNGSTLKLGGSTALGSTGGNLVIASGSTLDVNGYVSSRPIVVSGAGVDGNGAITDSGGAVYSSLAQSITLNGDTTFGYPNRWDFGSASSTNALSTGGQHHNLTLTSSGYFEWRNVAVDAALANITLTSGSMGIIGAGTTFGDPNATLTLSPGTTLAFYGAPWSVVNKRLDFQSGATIVNAGGNNVIAGPVTVGAGYQPINISGGTSLTLSNTLTGQGNLYLNGGNGALILAGNSPGFSGGVSLYSGRVIVNGSLGSGIVSQPYTVVSGTGTVSSLVDISGGLAPGDVGSVGTFHAQGGLVLQSGAVLTNDLATLPSGNNDLVQVTGDLMLNGNDFYINPIGGSLANASYTLMTYTGNLIGSLGNAYTVSPTAYTLTLVNVTTTSPKQIRLVVSGGQPNQLVWNNAGFSGQWDVQGWANWSNMVTHATPVQFLSLDSVLFDNSAGSATTVEIPSGTTVMPSAITVNASQDYTLTGAGQLAGVGSLTKQGSGTLTLDVAGSLSGPVTISGGAIKTAKPTLASAASITVTNGGTLDFDGVTMTGSKPVSVGGAGVSGKGALFNSGGGIYGNVLNLTLADDAIFGDSGRWDLGSGSSISGAHKLTLLHSASDGYREWDSVSIATNVSTIELAAGKLGVKNMTASFANPDTTFIVNTNCELTFWSGGWNGSLHIRSNGRVNLWTGPGAFTGSRLILDEGALWYAWSGGGDQTYGCAVTLNGVAHVLVGDYNRLYTNVISGTGGLLIENWNHQMVLSASNTYSGPTLIASGPQVALTGNGCISHSSLIFFGGNNAGSVHVDASGRADKTLTLAGGQTLAGIGAVAGELVVAPGATLAPAGTNTTLNITLGSNPTGRIAANNVTLNGTTVIKLNGSGNSDSVQAGGSLTYGGTLSLVNISGTPLAAGDSFTLFSATSYSGAFTNVTPATPGPGLAWDTAQLNQGKLSVVTAVVQKPVIVKPVISGGSLIFSGSNGVVGGSYQVLTSTNLSTPLNNWTVLSSGQFDAGGAFSFTNSVGAGQRFFILLVP